MTNFVRLACEHLDACIQAGQFKQNDALAIGTVMEALRTADKQRAVDVTNDGRHVTVQISIDVQEYLSRFGLPKSDRLPQDQKRWLKGKLRQEFNSKLNDAFPEPKEPCLKCGSTENVHCVEITKL